VWSNGKPGVEDLFLALDSDTAAYFGRLTKARDLSRRAIASAERFEEKQNSSHYQLMPHCVKL